MTAARNQVLCRTFFDPKFVDNTRLVSLEGLVGKFQVVLACIDLLFSLILSTSFKCGLILTTSYALSKVMQFS